MALSGAAIAEWTLEQRAKAQSERDAAILLAKWWSAFAEADPVPDPDELLALWESCGLVSLDAVKRGDLESDFAAERGIEPGGMVWRLTDEGRRAIKSAAAVVQRMERT